MSNPLSFIVVSTVLAVCAFGADAGMICNPFGSTWVANRYAVMNNRWGSTEKQCLEVYEDGFKVATQEGLTGSFIPLSNPAVYYGCHWGFCSPYPVIPIQVDVLESLNCQVSVTYPQNNSTYNSALEIWFDPTPHNMRQNALVMSIWVGKEGVSFPSGVPLGNYKIGGYEWTLYNGGNPFNKVISFITSDPSITEVDLDLLEFISCAQKYDLVQPTLYLTSVQATFAIWSNGVGLAYHDFEVNVK